MKKVDLRDLKHEVRNIRFFNVGEIALMSKYCLIAYAKSVGSFGVKHSVTSDVVSVWKEFWNIIMEEKALLNKLVEYGLFVDVDEADVFLDELDDLNEKMVRYYYNVLADIETACEMGTEWRAKRINKSFKTLIETDEYRRMVCAFCTLSFEDIKIFLDYDENFWEYIQTRILWVDSHLEDAKDFYGVNMKFDDVSCLIDMKIFVPSIINLDTALINVNVFSQAYQLYKKLGCLETSSLYEINAQECEEYFEVGYMKRKLTKFFGK